MKPVIAIDCDGVLTDTYPIWKKSYSRELCGTKHSIPAPPYNTLTWDSWEELCKPCFHDVCFNVDVLLALKPRAGVHAALELLTKVADLQVVTTRRDPDGSITRDWLFWNDLLPYFSAVHVSKDKRQVCEDIGAIALIDDAAHNIEALHGSSVVPVIYDMPYNQHLDGLRVFGWDDAREVLYTLTIQAEMKNAA